MPITPEQQKHLNNLIEAERAGKVLQYPDGSDGCWIRFPSALNSYSIYWLLNTSIRIKPEPPKPRERFVAAHFRGEESPIFQTQNAAEEWLLTRACPSNWTIVRYVEQLEDSK